MLSSVFKYQFNLYLYIYKITSSFPTNLDPNEIYQGLLLQTEHFF